ncbi:MAG: hypothetical protein KJO43_07270, partial [Phycisphaerae bacterium]|nr:hypothetical protein [Phycisphaerae bacterium]
PTADPEDMIFDKAERVTRIESLKAERDRLEAEATEMEKSLPALEESERAAREREVERLRGRAASITATLERVADQDTD